MQSVAAHPQLAAQWHPTRNAGLSPRAVPDYSPTPVWWKCPRGPDHEWRASPGNRRRGSGCPCCVNRKVSVTNSLASLRPEIAAEWHPTRNGALRPDGVTVGSNRAVFWRCPAVATHVYEARVAVRTGKRAAGCPYCAGRRVAADNSLARVRPDVAALWHPTRNGALRPTDVTSGSAREVWWKCPKGPDHEWRSKVAERTKYGCPFCRGLKTSKSGSLAARYKDIAREWHPDKNGALTPRDVVPGSNRNVWWRCARDASHEWQAVVAKRTAGAGRGCPFCSGRRVIRGGPGTVARWSSAVAREWHPTKNGKLRAADVSAGSCTPVWWKCPKGPDHEWRTTPAHRLKRGQGCPFCAGLRVSVTTALATVAPDLAAEWHPTRNGALTPRDVTIGSHATVVWQCRVNRRHVWSSTVHARHGTHGCPFCTRRRASDETSLAAREPRMAAQWHPAKNGALTPRDVVPGSNRNVWWKCPKGPDHEWRAVIAHRVRDRLGCPFCSKRRLSITNSLATLEPRLARQWHPTRNGALSPREVRVNSRESVWWKCAKGPDHEWDAPVWHRTRLGLGCPFCAGRRLSVTNAFAAKHPKLAAHWHPTRNGALRPDQIFSNSTRYIWWRCELGHVWQSQLHARVAKQSGCPTCYAQRARVRRPVTTRKVREVVRMPKG